MLMNLEEEDHPDYIGMNLATVSAIYYHVCKRYKESRYDLASGVTTRFPIFLAHIEGHSRLVILSRIHSPQKVQFHSTNIKTLRYHSGS